jgi:putative inorganic carbon (hco3(-)) transporter
LISILREYKLFFILSLLYIAMNAVFLAFEFYFFMVIPIVVLILAIAFFRLDILYFLVVFLTPLSVRLKEFVSGLSFDLNLPTEPLLIVVLGIFLLNYLKNGTNIKRKLLWHPVTIAILINLIWIGITSITSSMPLVSFKFFIARLWFLVTFYFLAAMVFENYINIKRFIWVSIIPIIMVIFYTLIRLQEYGWQDQTAAHFVMQPFYKDHTSYGAILAMFFPVFAGFIMNKYESQKVRIWATLVLLIISVAIVFSYTRASWISILGALGVLILVLLRVNFTYILMVGLAAGYLLWANWSDISMKLEGNEQDSSSNLTEHVQSISNISSDPSNVERINRWNSAIRMFREKPLFGWGPGTYMFQYAPFQNPNEKTIISTNSGNRGNAHSEYLGPLSESGLPGTITFLFIIVTTIITGLRVYYRSDNNEVKLIALSVLLGLITYYLHGFLNNFLDQDKASGPFWGFTAVIVVLDLYYTPKKRNLKVSENNPATLKAK